MTNRTRHVSVRKSATTRDVYRYGARWTGTGVAFGETEMAAGRVFFATCRSAGDYGVRTFGAESVGQRFDGVLAAGTCRYETGIEWTGRGLI